MCPMACQRNLINNGNVSLEQLVELTLHERLDKLSSVQLSKWSDKTLSDHQICMRRWM
jgi:hypothetical protein